MQGAYLAVSVSYRTSEAKEYQQWVIPLYQIDHAARETARTSMGTTKILDICGVVIIGYTWRNIIKESVYCVHFFPSQEHKYFHLVTLIWAVRA